MNQKGEAAAANRCSSSNIAMYLVLLAAVWSYQTGDQAATVVYKGYAAEVAIKLPATYQQIDKQYLSVTVEGEQNVVFVSTQNDTILYSLDAYHRPYFTTVELAEDCILSLDSAKIAERTAYIVLNSNRCGNTQIVAKQEVTFEYTIYIPVVVPNASPQADTPADQRSERMQTPIPGSLEIHISCSKKTGCQQLIADALRIAITHP